MRELNRNEVVAIIMNLNSVIDHITPENCYDKVIEFFKLTSKLQDSRKELEKLLPAIEGRKFYKWKSSQRKQSEEKRAEAEMQFESFMYEISKAGRNPYGYNRTETGETVTKDKVFFGNIWGIITLSVEELEKCPNDTYVQERVRNQITGFVRTYKNQFKTDWLNY